MRCLLLNLLLVIVSVSSSLPLAVFSVKGRVSWNFDLAEAPFGFVASETALVVLFFCE